MFLRVERRHLTEAGPFGDPTPVVRRSQGAWRTADPIWTEDRLRAPRREKEEEALDGSAERNLLVGLLDGLIEGRSMMIDGGFLDG